MEDEKLLELAARCEKATGPDREIDRAIQLAIRKSVPSDKWTGRDAIPSQKPRHFTASLDTAMTLVPEGYHPSWLLRKAIDDCLIAARDDGDESMGRLPLFVCAAAFRARASKED